MSHIWCQFTVSFLHGTESAEEWVPWAKYITDEGEDVALAAAEAGNLTLMDNPTLKGVTKANRDFYFVLVIISPKPRQHN